ncbi:hypothetical protein PCASD_10556 [Puccinia coronata f. sp. avenae]|uniref:Trafficking protein particle complex subunit n=1 Tax=Puccinia coronata f. sp. avenae TaxID=200324 RepID=A0A2N5UKS4_9BASI|nr:hypothetical protein PCASD_10556 [Puccinia coronata f. sp. avenae]
MTIYSFYVFDRHCAAVYYQDWHRSPLKAARPDPNVLQCVSPAISPMKEPNQAIINTGPIRQQSALGNLPFSNPTGVLVGGEEVPNDFQSHVSSSILKNSNPLSQKTSEKALDDHSQPSKYPGLPFDEEAKLVYEKEVLHGYTTSAYTLHILTTPTNQTFALFTSPMSESMRPALKTLWRTAWLDFCGSEPIGIY